jgi:hypothetical protein
MECSIIPIAVRSGAKFKFVIDPGRRITAEIVAILSFFQTGCLLAGCWAESFHRHPAASIFP